MAGTLYLVATPIGNLEDMTLRAIRLLKESDIVVFEERKEGGRLLRHFGVEKPVESLNEHNESAATAVILGYLRNGKNVSLISDAGTPVFSDPGQSLVRRAIGERIRIVPVPGASSLLPAIIVSGFSIDQFLFYGFLSPKRNRRAVELRTLRKEQRTVVLMEAPYRLLQVLRDIADIVGGERRVCVAFDLTLPTETIFRGTASELAARFAASRVKGEFVVVLEGLSK